MDEETSPTLLNTLKFEDVLRSIRDDVVNLAAEFISCTGASCQGLPALHCIL